MQHAGNSRNTKALAALMTPLSLLMLAIQFNVSAPVAAQTPSANAPNSSTSGPAYPLKLSANRRYLVDRNNQPFLIVGDTPQGLMGRLSEADADFYFADRQAHGFNTVGWIDVTCAGPTILLTPMRRPLMGSGRLMVSSPREPTSNIMTSASRTKPTSTVSTI